MKKTRFLVSGLILVIIGIIGTIISLFIMFTSTETIYLSEDFCSFVWGCTPQEFFDLELDLYNETEDFRKNASIGEDGRIILNLTQKQKDAWISSLQQEISVADNQNNNIEVSEALIIVYGYKDTVYDDLIEVFTISYKMQFVRFLSGIENSDMPEVIIKDGNTDKIVWTYSQHIGDVEDLLRIINEYNFAIETEND